jgi:hypothetical protein
MEKIKYITNKDIYEKFHIVVKNLNDITDEMKTQVVNKINVKAEVKITEKDLVYRLMTDAHIPEDPDGKSRKKGEGTTLAIRTVFPPFKHYILEDGEYREVGRSHWVGSLSNGEFCGDHGKISNRLATMIMLLVERYAKRGNWRNYCVDNTTEALTQRGWLKYNEITTDDIILSYELESKQLKWSKIKSIYRDNYEGKMFHLTVRGMDALVTPSHKFITQNGLKEVDYLLETDNVILMGAAVDGPKEKTYDDAFVELVGWFACKGCFDNSKKYPSTTLYQNEGIYADRIRMSLNNLNESFTEGFNKNKKNLNVIFRLSKIMREKLLEVIENSSEKNKVLKYDFILSLTNDQRELLLNTMIDADGWKTKVGPNGLNIGYCQKDKARLDAFLFLCTLCGHRVAYKKRNIITEVNKIETHIYNVNFFSKRANHSRVENINFHGGKNNGFAKGRGKFNHPNNPTVDYNDIVWCPETEYGTMLARRNGTIYLSGQTYNDEMRGNAMLQLAQVALQFDESKSDNPFAFYTQIIKNSFRRVLNIEKRNQDIRDDLLIVAGATPSFTRQVENEMEQHAANEKPDEKTITKKRGRKAKVK